MKKLEKFLMLLLIVIGVTLFTACSDDKDEPQPPIKQETTYTITSESSAGQIAQANGLTSKLNYTLIEYNNSNEVVNIQDWYNVSDGVSTKKFTANQFATKLVIKYSVYAYKNGIEVANDGGYYAIVYYLNINSNLQITLNGSSKVSKYNPL